ncbi:hypothetical protein [Luteibacter aegosomatissinici]|uniref:hypothetical protein n=1 Tax=Luteibacter aegosomatissinici TaxID=2911539 RepID=UPI001FF9F15B|nr:hypothetical protein [Luteibacter aegosomatissinici]UPG93900.1 hypothetical protein L2Y97_19000 [Luteibacter aegosomatissinici]
MDYAGAIERAAVAKRPLLAVCSELFLLGPTHGFAGWEEESFALFHEIADFFQVSVRAIHVCGSAKLGFSPTKKTQFTAGSSDLDVAVVDPQCFQRYVERIVHETNGYRDRSAFPRKDDGRSLYEDFKYYMAKGMLRPDLMPLIAERVEWARFFAGLSRKHSRRFKRISAAVYLSDSLFAMKQMSALQQYINEKEFL